MAVPRPVVALHSGIRLEQLLNVQREVLSLISRNAPLQQSLTASQSSLKPGFPV